MAAPTPPLPSQKQRRAASRKERRRRKRQAQARECALMDGALCPSPEEEEADEEDVAEEERQRLHQLWLERERLAQEEFRLRCEREEAALKRKEEEERSIREEWEAQQRREQEEQEKKQQEKRDREAAVQRRLDEAETQLETSGPWMNPEAPPTEISENFGTERDAANCPFFLKTGACRFGDRCSRKHTYPPASPTLMIRAMFKTFGMEECRRDDYDVDACLEHSEEELQESFIDFYHDVLPEFKSVGKVVQFKVSCNYEPHLRGNTYVQFDTEEQCRDALVRFNGRWYAGRQLHCEVCPVTRWKTAICGLFDRRKCPKGKHCNFLHVFRNPGNEFWEADRDLNVSPDGGGRTSHRDSGWHSERHGDRGWRPRRRSRSPPRSQRSHGGWRDRRTPRQHSEDRRTLRATRGRRRSTSPYRSRSRDGDRRRSPDGEDVRDRDGGQGRGGRTSLEKDDGGGRSHKHSKKKKKKKKKSKKSKKKSRLSTGTRSPEDSGDESEDDTRSQRDSKDESEDDTRPGTKLDRDKMTSEDAEILSEAEAR